MTTRRMRLAVVIVCLGLCAAHASAQTATAVSANSVQTCALTSGGGVVCWGWNYYGQVGDGTKTDRATPTPVAGLSSGVLAVATGNSHACALTSGGGVVCWGYNGLGQLGDGTTTDRLVPTPVSGLSSGVLAITVGTSHTCALTSGGAALCWGNNYYGRLGDGTTTYRPTPTPVSGLSSDVASIAAGAAHTCAVTMSGAAKCWGSNSSGQLGDATTTDRLTPTPVSGLSSDAASIAAGGSHTCAVTTSGAAKCWGYNYYGQIGDETTTNRPSPTPVSGLSSGVLSVAAGHSHTCAVTSGGAASCWGQNEYSALGDGTMTSRPAPTPVTGLSGGVAAIAAGGGHTCALMSDGDVTCWGNNSYGQLGDGTVANRPTPAAASGLSSGVASLAAGPAGSNHTCAVTTGGAARCWGANAYGQIGDGTVTDRQTSVGVSGLSSGVASIALGQNHTCAVTTGGAAWCWGYNASGQLGDGDLEDELTPTAVSGLSAGTAAIAAGWMHTCAVTTGGAARCWGYNGDGQLGDGTYTEHLTQRPVTGLDSGVAKIVAGNSHTCALLTTGAVKCWGNNEYGQVGDGLWKDKLTPTAVSGLSIGVEAIAAGAYHTCALLTGGAVKCWGYNGQGQVGDGTTTHRSVPTPVIGLPSGVTAVTGGGSHTCAVTTGGAATCWGDNYTGQLGDGTTTDRLTQTPVAGLSSGAAAITAGSAHTCALTTGGGTLCWGGGSRGALGTGSRVIGLAPLPAYGLGGAIAAGAATPNHGDEEGGAVVTIAGAYFLQGATVTIGGVAAAAVSVINTTEILAVTGPHAAGRVDVVVTNPDATQATLTGGFTYGDARVPTGDFTGDLKSDVLWHHATNGEVWVWPMDGAARTAETYVRTIGDTDWEIRGQGDQDGDGDADILWRNKATGAIYFWPMTGTTPDDEIYVGTVDPAYDIVGTGDFDGDRKSDILWRHLTTGEVWIWLMDGPAPVSEVWVDTVDPAYVVRGVGDLDADTKADIVWHHATLGEVWVWLMNGTARLSQTWVATVPDTGYQIQGVADFTGEGHADIVWHHATLGEVWIWTMNGAAREAETWVGTVPDVGYQIVGTGNYNGDTMADLLWHHATNGEVWVWLMDGTTPISQTWVATVPDTGYRIIR